MVKQRRADVFVDPAEDPRPEPSGTAGERDMLIGFLRWQRATLELKCEELTPDQLAARAVEPSTMSLLGLVRHMTDVERGWFRWFMAGEEVADRFSSKGEPDAAFDGAVGKPHVVSEALAAWKEEISSSDAYVGTAPDLDVLGKRTDPRGPLSLRWVLVHMIEEYARHNGHADLLRERIDGRLGQ